MTKWSKAQTAIQFPSEEPEEDDDESEWVK